MEAEPLVRFGNNTKAQIELKQRYLQYASKCEEWEQQVLSRKIERDRKVQRGRLDE